MIEPDLAIALKIHKKTCGDNKIRGKEGLNLLDSALNIALSPYFEKVEEKACRLLVGVIKNHPFVDCNKRTAWVLFREFCKQNGIKPRIPSTLKVVEFLELIACSQENIEELLRKCLYFFF